MSTEPKTGEEPFADLVVGLRAAIPELEPSPSLLPDLRRRYARRTALRRTGYAAIPVALVAAVGVGAMLIPHGSPAPEAVPPTNTPAPVVRDAAQVVAQVNKALDNASEDIIGESRAMDSGALGLPIPGGKSGTYKAWVSMTTGDRVGTFSVGGQPVFESGLSAPDEFTAIFYSDRTYTTSHYVNDTPPDEVGHDTFAPEQIKSAISSGKLAITARNQQVDGQSTIELTGTLIPADEAGPNAKAVPQRFWVNSTSYLPVRWETLDKQGNWQQTTDFTWLAPTPENKALLIVKIPAGFTKKN
ncbi:MAG TPA: hypothetical protein VGJ45_05945 [Pseudonocardiaceae bacterium]|jgi:hypothetical protein